MPEYINMNASSYEILVEISCCKYPPADKLMKFWQDNKDALINLMFTVHMGVKGLILAQSNDNNSLFLPKEGAEVVIVGRESIKFRSTKYGEYFKLLLPGNYTLKVDYPGYLSITTAFHVDKSGVTRLDINLIQMSNTTDISLSKPPGNDQNTSINFSDSLRRGQSLTKDALLFLALFTVFYLS
uniref:Carboxypeptidase D n=1 Tax=Arion vulgaris TaxID=1028688 RepID=A0A0B7A821_9EUPU